MSLSENEILEDKTEDSENLKDQQKEDQEDGTDIETSENIEQPVVDILQIDSDSNDLLDVLEDIQEEFSAYVDEQKENCVVYENDQIVVYSEVVEDGAVVNESNEAWALFNTNSDRPAEVVGLFVVAAILGAILSLVTWKKVRT